jgi:hypothetical protein
MPALDFFKEHGGAHTLAPAARTTLAVWRLDSSFLSNVGAKLLFHLLFPHNVNYHAEHHLAPQVTEMLCFDGSMQMLYGSLNRYACTNLNTGFIQVGHTDLPALHSTLATRQTRANVCDIREALALVFKPPSSDGGPISTAS